MFTQSDTIRDYVFPLAQVGKKDGGWTFTRFLGSGFLIGDRGFGLTAAHIATESEEKDMVAMFAAESGDWIAVPILDYEKHEREDVAVVKLQGDSWRSYFQLSNSWEGSSARYRMFGYPEDATYELDSASRVQARPDLIYAEGYVRRRTNHDIPGMIGSRFFELSDVAGRGCSGAPVFKFTKPVWDVIGIYVGEKINNRATSVAYAVREEAFRTWEPILLNTSVLEESQKVSV